MTPLGTSGGAFLVRRAQTEKVGVRPVRSSAAEFAAQIRSEVDRMKKLVRERQIKLDE